LIEHFAARQRWLTESGRLGGRGALALACSDGGVLPHVGDEGRAVVSALGGQLLCDDEATLSALRANAGDCAVLHLAAHAVFRPDEPLFSALHLNDGRLSTMDVFELELDCSLVTLSACETALGTMGAGDELMGLSRAFLYAGAPSLVLSLWKVEDRSTAALMDVFYRALRDGAGKAAALRRAQLALLHGGGGHSAPYFWAPFELIGHAGPLAG
jgi:CHAT domain-containing protein